METINESVNLKQWAPDFPLFDYKNRPKGIQPKAIKPFSLIICASRNSGKSVLFRCLYEQHFEGQFDIVILFSNTLGNGFYDEFIPNKTKFHHFDEGVLTNLLEIQEKQKKTSGFYLNTLVIFDDCIGDDVKNSEVIQDLFVLGRHKAISIVFITQTPTFCKTSWRVNTTHLIVLRIKGSGLDHIIDSFLSDLIEEDDITIPGMKADKYLRYLIKQTFSEKFRALVIDYNLEGSKLTECMFTHRCDGVFKQRRNWEQTK